MRPGDISLSFYKAHMYNIQSWCALLNSKRLAVNYFCFNVVGSCAIMSSNLSIRFNETAE